MPRPVVPILPAPARLLARQVERRVVGQEHVGAVGDDQAAVEAHAGRAQPCRSRSSSASGVDDHAVAEHAELVRVEDAGRDEAAARSAGRRT